MDVLINTYNMGEIEGVRQALPGATTKYVTDLILDSIIYQWRISIPHSPRKTDKRKIRLSERHLSFVEKYATQKHISATIATNLILNDYFLGQIDIKTSDVAKISPTSTETKPSPTPQAVTPKPKGNRGISLLEDLKI